MPNANPGQKLSAPRPGTPLSAKREESLIFQMRRLIKGGKNVNVQWVGDQCLIEVLQTGRRGTAPAAETEFPTIWYTAASKAELQNEDVSQTALGRVISGDQNGMVCVRNPAHDGWDALNVLE